MLALSTMSQSESSCWRWADHGLQTGRKRRRTKITKYGPLRWELKKKYQGHEVKQYNIIMDVLGGWCRDLEVKLKELVGSKSKGVFHNMQKAVLSGTLNIWVGSLKLQHEQWISHSTFKVMKYSSMNFYSRISDIFERIRSIYWWC